MKNTINVNIKKAVIRQIYIDFSDQETPEFVVQGHYLTDQGTKVGDFSFRNYRWAGSQSLNIPALAHMAAAELISQLSVEVHRTINSIDKILPTPKKK